MVSVAPAEEAIQVAVRVRPLNKRELDMQDIVAVRCNAGGIIEVFKDDALKDFQFDWVYGMDSDQRSVEKDLGESLLNNCTNGYNSCVFAYGQTGAGKSWSVMGLKNDPELRGLLPRICEGIFTRLAGDSDVAEYRVNCAYLEIYNEKMKDLLVPNSGTLEIRKHPIFGIHVPHLTECEVQSFDEVDKILTKGSSNRNVAATAMNAESSRSHAVFTITTTSTMTDKRTRRAELHIVDLAGSERQKKTGASGARLKEGASINQSLTVLGQVIFALGSRQSGAGSEHVPFRNSKLTYLLSDSLSGNSKTVMIAAVSPAANNFDETLNTLRFAQSVKKVKTSVVKNEAQSSDPQEVIRQLRMEIEEMRKSAAAGVRRASLMDDSDAPLQLASMRHEMSAQINKRRQTLMTLSPGDFGALMEEEDDDEYESKEKYNGFSEQLIEYIQWSLDIPVDWAFLDNSSQFLNAMDKKRKKDQERARDFKDRLAQLSSDVEQANFLCAWMMEHNFMPRGEAQSKWRVGIAWHINEEAPQLEGTLQAMFQQQRDDGSELVLSSYDEEEFTRIRAALEEHFEMCEKQLNDDELHQKRQSHTAAPVEKKQARIEAVPEEEVTKKASVAVAETRRKMRSMKTVEFAKEALVESERLEPFVGSTRIRAESMRSESVAEEAGTLRSENQYLVQELENLRVNNQTLRSKNDEMAAGYAGLQAQLEAAQAQAAHAQAQVEAANAQVAALKAAAAAAPAQVENGGGKPVTLDLFSKAVADEVPSGASTPRTGGASPRRGNNSQPNVRSPALSRAGSMKSDIVERVAGPEVKKIGLSFRTPPPGKLMVAVVDAGSWAEQEGIREGDEIIEINNVPCVAMPTDDFRRTMKDIRPIRFKLTVQPARSSAGKTSPGAAAGYPGTGSGRLSPPSAARGRAESPRAMTGGRQVASPMPGSQSMTSPRSPPTSPSLGNAQLSRSLQARPAAQRAASRSVSRGPK